MSVPVGSNVSKLTSTDGVMSGVTVRNNSASAVRVAITSGKAYCLKSRFPPRHIPQRSATPPVAIIAIRRRRTILSDILSVDFKVIDYNNPELQYTREPQLHIL